ncbi:MAG: GntR family transcriptional regulator [Solirubrobacterales bacterium]
MKDLSTETAAIHDDSGRPRAGQSAVSEDDLWASLPQRLDGRSTADAVHDAMVGGIRSGRLAPGTRLGEVYLASLFSVSRTPVREALMRLEAEHVVERDRHRGLVVSRVTVEQIIEIYVVREALDGAAARLAASSAQILDIEELAQVNEELARAAAAGRFEEMASLNVDFHHILARASRNEMLMRFTAQVHQVVQRFRTTTFTYPGRAALAVEEHRAILDALRRRNPEEAERTAREHMRRALDVRVKLEIGARGARSVD